MTDSHPITIAPAAGRVRVTWRDHVVVDTLHALELKEHVYPPVIYVPREDAEMALLTRTSRETTCPYKGVANYFSLVAPDASDANAIWTYEHPKDGVAAIKDHLAFYPDKVQIIRG
jgi:uncharacterized protein (DUF427 family)